MIIVIIILNAVAAIFNLTLGILAWRKKIYYNSFDRKVMMITHFAVSIFGFGVISFLIYGFVGG